MRNYSYLPQARTAQRGLIIVVALFIGLTVAGVGMIVGAQTLAAPFAQQALVAVGAALFSAGLTVFLLEALRYDRTR
jgi:hypothetical protein